MAETVIEVRTLRRGSRWVTVVTVDAPGLKAPVDFSSSADVREEIGTLRSLFGLNTEAVAEASAASRRKSVERAVGCTRGFVTKYPSYLGASVGWARDVLTALDKSSSLLRSARAGDKDSQGKISAIYQKAKSGDADARRSARLLQESARLSDEGRATLRVKLEKTESTGHDIGTRADLRLLPMGGMHVGGLQDVSSHRHGIPTRVVHDDDDELRVFDPFQHASYSHTERDISN